MRTLNEPAEWSDVLVFEPGQDAYGPWVVDTPVAALMRRTEFLMEAVIDLQTRNTTLENRVAELEPSA